MGRYPGQGVLDMRTGSKSRWKREQWWQPENAQYTPPQWPPPQWPPGSTGPPVMPYGPPTAARPYPLQPPGSHPLHPTPIPGSHYLPSTPTPTSTSTEPNPNHKQPPSTPLSASQEPSPQHPPPISATATTTTPAPLQKPEIPPSGHIPPPTPKSASVPPSPADQQSTGNATSPPPQTTSAETAQRNSRKRLNRQQVIQLVEICLSKKKFWGQIPFKDFWAQVTNQFMKVSGTDFTGCAARMGHMVKARYAWIASHGGEVRPGMEIKDEILDSLMDQWIECIETHQKQLEGKRDAAYRDMSRTMDDIPLVEQGARKRRRIHQEFGAPVAASDGSSHEETTGEDDNDVEFHEAPEEPNAYWTEHGERRAGMQASNGQTPASQSSASFGDGDSESARKRRKLKAPQERTGNRLSHLKGTIHALAEGILEQAKAETDVKAELAALRATVEDQKRQIEALIGVQEKLNTVLESILDSVKKKGLLVGPEVEEPGLAGP